jgi:AcrR family transcriptional regulator
MVRYFANLFAALRDNGEMGRRRKFSREDVLDKTIPVFWKHGLAETSVQDLEQATGVNKSGLYAEFEDKDDLFAASLRRYIDLLQERGTLTKQPLGWNNIEAFLKLCHGGWGQRGCFSVNSMREFSDLPPQARDLMIGNVTKLKRQLIRNLSVAREKNRDNNDALAGLVLTFFCGICLEQNLNPAEKQIAEKIAQFMQLIRAV